MEARSRNLKDIFDTQCRYLVPLFQRPYVWKKENQWLPLWEDVQALAERYENKDTTHPHFMGAVVLDQIPNPAGTIDRRQIIDGQQRLTTLQIVIEAACDVCDTLGSVAANHAHALRRLTRNDSYSEDIESEEIYKVWPTNVDREHFRRVMKAGSPEDLHEMYNGKNQHDVGYAIADAYFFFHGKIAAWLEPVDEGVLKTRLDALRDALYRGLLIVAIDLDEKDDAQIIFETLNARGTPLLASDLVKNFLLHQAEAQGYKLDPLYEKYWKPFDADAFWRTETRTGRFKRPHIEVFFQHYLTLLTGTEILATNLFTTFRQYMKQHPDLDPEYYLAELHRYGQLYRQFFAYPIETPEGMFFRRVEILDTTTIFPLLLQVFDRLSKPSQASMRQELLAALESFLVRRMICELTTKNYNNLFSEAGKMLVKVDGPDMPKTLREFLVGQTSDIGRWPDDEDFLKAWQKLDAYNRLRPQARLRMILEALELHLRGSGLSEETSLPKASLSIEHILPQGWQANYPLAESTPEMKEVREALVHTIGNLTLVTGKLNSTLSNAPWSAKSKTLQKNSVLLLNAQLVDNGTWGDDEIRARSKQLFTYAKKIWSRPILSSEKT